jgi:hypothetical protein
MEAQVFNGIYHISCAITTNFLVRLCHQLLQFFLTHCLLLEAHFIGQNAVEQCPANSCDFRFSLRAAVIIVIAQQDGCVQSNLT